MKVITQAFRIVFGWQYLGVAAASALIFLLFNLWLLNLGYLGYLIRHSHLPAFEIATSFFDIKVLSAVRLMPLEFAVLALIALLTGINVALAAYLMRRNMLARGSKRLIGVGALAALVGVGCLSCGTSLLAAFVGIALSSALVGTLPLHGLEFSLFAILVLGFSIWQLSRKVVGPESCRI